MTELEKFYDLKEKVLLKYQEHYPYFQGNWKSFSSQDIQNLIAIIEEKTKQTISEKWIYTHLKPTTNEKLPRKDTLTILSKFVGFSGWDEFVFEEKANEISEKNKPKSKFLVWIAIAIFGLFGLFFVYKSFLNKTNSIKIKNEFTNEKINSKEVKVYKIEDSVKTEIEIKDSKIELNSENENAKIIIESPYFKKKTIEIKSDSNAEITLKPDDFAMMLKAFIKSDIKDWQTRKLQLNQILSDDLEVIVILKDNLGAEYFNKTDFSQKLILPTETTKKMQIIEIEKDENNKIKFIRINQE